MASVLVVDPDSSRAKIVTDALSRSGHGGRRVESAAAAIETLDAGLFDLVVVADGAHSALRARLMPQARAPLLQRRTRHHERQ